jgi:hypothetical protein
VRDQLIAALMLEGRFEDDSFHFSGTAKSTNRAKEGHKTKLLNTIQLAELSGSIIILKIVRVQCQFLCRITGFYIEPYSDMSSEKPKSRFCLR